MLPFMRWQYLIKQGVFLTADKKHYEKTNYVDEK